MTTREAARYLASFSDDYDEGDLFDHDSGRVFRHHVEHLFALAIEQACKINPQQSMVRYDAKRALEARRVLLEYAG